MDAKFDYDLVVIGAGPGGYVSAVRASQLGLKVAIIEKNKLGGVCLNIGCIPSKALIHQAELFHRFKDLKTFGVEVNTENFDYTKVHQKSRKAADILSRGVQFLMKKNNIEVIADEAKLHSPNEVKLTNTNKTISAKNILIATGSGPMQIPGFEINEEDVISSTGALMMTELPKKMLILGAGAIGVEFAYVFKAFGVEVEVVELMDHLLPSEDEEIAAILERSFKKQKIKVHTKTKASKMERSDGQIKVTLEQGENEKIVEVDKVLVAVGRRPNTENLGLDELGIETDRGFIKFGDYYQTNVQSVYAIGDVVKTPLLAHVASKEGEIAVEHMAGHDTPKMIDLMAIPGATYCEPQVASFGLTEKKAKEQNIKYVKATFNYRAIGKAMACEQGDGLVKVLTDPDTKEILGGHIIGANATETLHEMLLAKSAELLPQDVATMVHAHPTISEGVMEAMRAVEGWAIHG